jgi:hypothetical protein
MSSLICRDITDFGGLKALIALLYHRIYYCKLNGRKRIHIARMCMYAFEWITVTIGTFPCLACSDYYTSP